MSLLRKLVLVLAVFAVATPLGCSSDKAAKEVESDASQPAGDQLKESAARMREVRTVRFAIETSGSVAGIPLRGARGQLTREGAAKGTVQLDQGGATTELEFVIVDGRAYLKGPTGGWQSMSENLVSSVYNPTAILDPDRGLAKLVETARDARIETTEEIDGVRAHRIAATFEPEVVAVLVPGAGAGITGQMWIDTERKVLVQVKFKVPASGGSAAATATVRLSEYNEPVSISAPS